MKIEYEATFTNIDETKIKEKLKELGAELIKPEFLQKRKTFNLPTPEEKTWLRVRDEQDKITISAKRVDGDKIHNQKEICLEINDFDSAVELLNLIGCHEKAYQENKRELWKLDNVEITIDKWPFLEPIIEIEGENEEAIKKVSEKLGFDYSKAKFCSATELYQEEYNLSAYKINNETPKITFEMENPFI
jgi:adenylate cyclase class 2